MTRGKVCFLATLCTLIIFSSFISSTQSASCCLSYVKRPLSCSRLLGYTIQTINASCDINAVIFHIPGRFVCANPSSSWTRRALECLAQRRKRNAEIMKQSTQGHTTSA